MSSRPRHVTPQTDWFKSSYSSSTGTCVEVRFADAQVGVRDSKSSQSDESALTIAPQHWAAFIAGLSA
ncbi:DUF397 domain-containing protein [Haloechinothrix alba]|uniref:DUF397 domain-containing protein n=1 Tax=Haloechinothrix alba TaxID=664784 RepID=UPI000B76C583|nr:DUF397 domain-containing protein [Haloechinothrix alba]